MAFNPTPLEPMYGLPITTLHPDEKRYVDVFTTEAGENARTDEVRVIYDPKIGAPNLIPRSRRWFDIEATGRDVSPTREPFLLIFDGAGEASIIRRLDTTEATE